MTRTNRLHHRTRTTRVRIVATAATVALVALACGADDDTAAPAATSEDTTPEATTATSGDTTPPATGGWVDGEPDFDGGADGGEREAAAAAESDGGADEADEAYAVDAEDAMTAEPVGDDVVEPVPQGPLRAGSVDDNVDFADFVAYLERIASLGITTRDYDPTGRIVVSVTGNEGRPVAGAAVTFAVDGVDVASLRTTADGTVRFHPALHGVTGSTFEVRADGAAATVEAGGTASLSLDVPGGAEAPVPLDVLFLLDATGSMGDEIDRLKQSVDSVAARVAALESRPDVRFAMTLYRDEEDAFVTSTYDFTADVDGFRQALAAVEAGGGGDYPEALDEGLADALAAPGWRDPAETVQLVFLVADAPPQVSRQVDTPYPASIVDAVGRGIKIFPVASSESDDQAEAVFRQLAQATGARFVFLTYGAGGAATGGSTDIDRTDYEELALDDLVVRLVAEELAALTGEQPPPPSTTVPDTTNPEGQ